MAETGSENAMQDFTVRRRIGGLTVLAVTAAALVYFSVQSVRVALADPTAPLWLRGPLFLASAALMILTLCIVVPPLHRKWEKGRFLMTRAEAAAKRAEYRSQMGAGKPLWPQARFWAVPCVLVLMLASFGVFALAGALMRCDCSRRFSGLLLLLAAVLFLLPGMFAFKAVRRKIKSGSFLPSQEELDKARARCAQPKSLRQRIWLAALWSFNALLWTGTALGRLHRHTATSSTWVVVAVTWMAAVLWIWQVFRASPPQCSLSITPDRQTPPDSPISQFE
jgi:hypothetical protein